MRRDSSGRSAGSEWRKYEVSALIKTGALEIGDGYRAKNNEFTPSGLPFARAGNIKDGFQFADADRFPEENLKRIGNKISEPGDVVFTSKGTVGRFAFVREDIPRFVYSPQLCFWRSRDHELIDPRFLFYWMSGREFFVQFKGVAGQTDMAEYVSLRDQRNMHLTLPPLPEQRAIAHILGSLDDKIELNRRMNETREEMARTLFKSWFIDFDPVHAKATLRNHTPNHSSLDWTVEMAQAYLDGMDPGIAALFPDRFVDSELGEIPGGWEVKPLDTVAVFQNGLALQKFRPQENEEWLPVVKIAQLRSGKADSGERSTANIRPECIIDDGDIVFSWSGSLTVKVWCGGRAALNQHLFKVTSVNFPKWFFMHCVCSHLGDFQTIAAGKATTMGHIKRHHLSEAMCVVPNGELLAESDSLFSTLLERNISANIQSRALITLRGTLLPKLISGELRVKDSKRFLESVS